MWLGLGLPALTLPSAAAAQDRPPGVSPERAPGAGPGPAPGVRFELPSGTFNFALGRD